MGHIKVGKVQAVVTIENVDSSCTFEVIEEIIDLGKHKKLLVRAVIFYCNWSSGGKCEGVHGYRVVYCIDPFTKRLKVIFVWFGSWFVIENMSIIIF